MATLIGIAVLVVATYAVVLRFVERGNALAVFLWLGSVIFSGSVCLLGLYGFSLLAPALPVRVADDRVWFWPSVWRHAGFTVAITAVGAILLFATFALRRRSKRPVT